jgi:hypothetical protein
VPVLPAHVLDDYQKKDVVRAEHRGVLDSVGINAVVQKGALASVSLNSA